MSQEITESKTPLVITALILMAGAIAFPLIGPSLTGQTKILFVAGLSFALVLATSLQFMHLKEDAKKLWLILVPTILLGLVILVALLPDTILYKNR